MSRNLSILVLIHRSQTVVYFTIDASAALSSASILGTLSSGTPLSGNVTVGGESSLIRVITIGSTG
jgi:hypothetical protein